MRGSSFPKKKRILHEGSTCKRAGELKTESVAASFTMRASNAARSKAVRASLVLERFLSIKTVGFLGLVSQETNGFDIPPSFLASRFAHRLIATRRIIVVWKISITKVRSCTYLRTACPSRLFNSACNSACSVSTNCRASRPERPTCCRSHCKARSRRISSASSMPRCRAMPRAMRR